MAAKKSVLWQGQIQDSVDSNIKNERKAKIFRPHPLFSANNLRAAGEKPEQFFCKSAKSNGKHLCARCTCNSMCKLLFVSIWFRWLFVQLGLSIMD